GSLGNPTGLPIRPRAEGTVRNVIKLTNAIIAKLAPGVYRDAVAPGLVLHVGKGTRAFRFESEQRINGKRVAISKALGRFPEDVKVEQARRAAQQERGRPARKAYPKTLVDGWLAFRDTLK